MVPLKRARDRIYENLPPIFRNKKFRRITVGIFFFLILTLILSIDFVPQKVNLAEGQVSPRTIYASHSIVFEDRAQTEEEKKRAAEQVPNVYKHNPEVNQGVGNNISQAIEDIISIKNSSELSKDQKIESLEREILFDLPDTVINDLLGSSDQVLQQIKTSINNLIAAAYENQINADNIDEFKADLTNEIKNMKFLNSYEIFAVDLVNYYLRPNSFFDAEETQIRRDAARETVVPVQVSIKQGQKIIGEGDIVNQEHLTKLEALGLLRPQLPFTAIIGTALIALGGIFLVLLYLYQYHREMYEKEGYLMLMGIIVITTLAISKVLVSINFTRWPELSNLFGYLIPLAAASMIIAILIDSRLAILVTALSAVLVGIMTGNQLKFAVVALIAGIVGVFSVSKLSQRGDLVRAGVYISLSTALAIFAFGLINFTSFALLISSSLILGIINGMLSSILTIGMLPYLETTFGITSAIRLLELSNPNHPLLKKLLLETPGTYHHSIIVGNLAEAAADAVDAETLAVRVGAYYHDIGKIKRPYFFIENQLSAENPHDKLSPSLSTLILTSHVKDGVEMAKKYNLPQIIIDIVEQHHGTGLASFFYHKALENDKSDISEDEFRYEGPKPQHKEAAIIMLADSVEAAVRSLKNPTPGRIEGLVRKIIKEKLMDGQLDECDLTLKDLDKIANAFLRVLSGIYHSRIEYPDNVIKEIERGKNKNVDNS